MSEFLFLGLTAILIILVLICIYISWKPISDLVLSSPNEDIRVEGNVFPSKELGESKRMFNLSARRDSRGFTGVIRGYSLEGYRIMNIPSAVSWPIFIRLSVEGEIEDLKVISFPGMNFSHCGMPIFTNGIEDPRIFSFKGEDWCIANCLGFFEQKYPCVNTMCIFKISSPQLSFRLLKSPIGVKSTQPQKNWSPFEFQGKLYCEYSIEPHEILSIDHENGDVHTAGWSSWRERNGSPIFSNSSLRGGAPPIRIGDIFLGVGHLRPTMGDYYHFFYSFRASSPFKITAISSIFKLGGNEAIQFAAGLSLYEDQVYISYGVGDHFNRISSFPLETVMTMLSNPTLLHNGLSPVNGAS